MLKVILASFILASSLPSWAGPEGRTCFTDHLRESIAVNSARKKVYSAVTNGKSDRVFNKLIRSEYLALPVARFYDFRAHNLELFCNEFKPMNGLPDVRFDQLKIPESNFIPFEWLPHQRLLLQAVKARDSVKMKQISLEAIYFLAATPEYHCMVRHILESIYRFAYFLPTHSPAAQKLSLEVIKLQLLSLKTSSQIDEWSAPLQQKGIPILCAELPPLLDDLVLD